MKIVIDWLDDGGELVDVTRIGDVGPPAASLAGTSAQARHTADDTAGGA